MLNLGRGGTGIGGAVYIIVAGAGGGGGTAGSASFMYTVPQNGQRYVSVAAVIGAPQVLQTNFS